jgi:hypothetical protein
LVLAESCGGITADFADGFLQFKKCRLRGDWCCKRTRTILQTQRPDQFDNALKLLLACALLRLLAGIKPGKS